jgi:hypothetical protein
VTILDLDFWLMLIAAVPAGTGGALLGDRAVGWALARRRATRPDEFR